MVDLDGDDVLVASTADGAVIARWVPAMSLAAVTTEEVALSPTKGAPGDPAIVVRPGMLVPARGSGALEVHARGRIVADGWVPARVRGRMWRADGDPLFARARGNYVVRAAPDPSARIRAHLNDANVRLLRAAGERWLEVEAFDNQIIVHGFVERPQPPPTVEESEGYGDDSPPPEHVAMYTCLFDKPDGAAAGMVVGYVPHAPRAAAAAGWMALRVKTAWGARDYFFKPPPPRDENTIYQFDDAPLE